MKSFTLKLGETATLKHSGETGEVRGQATFDNGEDQFMITGVAANGRQVTQWHDESQINVSPKKFINSILEEERDKGFVSVDLATLCPTDWTPDGVLTRAEGMVIAEVYPSLTHQTTWRVKDWNTDAPDGELVAKGATDTPEEAIQIATETMMKHIEKS